MTILFTVIAEVPESRLPKEFEEDFIRDAIGMLMKTQGDKPIVGVIVKVEDYDKKLA